MAVLAGGEAWGYITQWVREPQWRSIGGGVFLPVELTLLSVNFCANWNAKKISTWLNAHSTALIASLVPMIYR
jgi:hypothetical protein